MENKHFMELKFTKDYDLFQFLDYNRPSEDESAINKIAELIKQYGFLVPILAVERNGKYFIIDGQHRIKAAIKVNAKICYILLNIEDDEVLPLLISKMNSTQKNWKIGEYFDMWVKLGKDEYLKTKNFYEELEISQDEFFYITRNPKNSLFTKGIKDGEFILKDNYVKKVKKTIGFMEDIISVDEITELLRKNNTFRYSIIKLVENSKYQHERFMKFFPECTGSINKRWNRQAYLGFFESIHNDKLREENRIKIAA